MLFLRRDMGFLFLLILVLAACAPGVSPNSAPQTSPGTTPIIAPGTATTSVPGETPKAGSGAATVSVSKATPGTVLATVTDPAPVQALERYLGALTSKNESVFTQSICMDWENQAFLEFDAYQGLELELKGLACRVTANGAGEAQATCQGKIMLNYGNERQEVDLSKRNYRLTFHNDQWQVCGFSE